MEWRDIPGFESFYQVSDEGQVRRTSNSRILRTRLSGGYHVLTLSTPAKQSMMRVHRLVALAFLGPGQAGQEVCHGDGVKTNNHLSNLRWDTHAANMRDMVLHGAPHLAPRQVCRKEGHPMTVENTVRNGGGRRLCRTCRNAYQLGKNRERRAKLKWMRDEGA